MTFKIKWSEVPNEREKDYICAYHFKVKTRTGKIIDRCFVQGRHEEWPSLMVPTKEFGILKFQYSWQNLRNAIENEKPIAL